MTEKSPYTEAEYAAYAALRKDVTGQAKTVLDLGMALPMTVYNAIAEERGDPPLEIHCDFAFKGDPFKGLPERVWIGHNSASNQRYYTRRGGFTAPYVRDNALLHNLTEFYVQIMRWAWGNPSDLDDGDVADLAHRLDLAKDDQPIPELREHFER